MMFNDRNDPIATRQQIIEAVKGIRGGTLFRLEYITEVPLKAEFKKKGLKVTKRVCTTTRTGVQYKNILGVVLSQGGEKRTSNYSWVVPNKVRYNSNTDKTYLYTAPIRSGGNTCVEFEIIYPEDMLLGDCGVVISAESLKMLNIVQESYWSKGHRPINDINIDNIIRIG